MKHRRILLWITLSTMFVLAGCSKAQENIDTEDNSAAPTVEIVTDTTATDVQTEETTDTEEETREGMYRSELTNEWIDESLKNQRPVAIMIDNDERALDHYGISHADVLYEMTNSTKNKGITRLMAIIKDYEDIELIGSMRSARPSYIQLMTEWNAVYCYFGGPFYIDDYIAKDHVDSLNGNAGNTWNKRADNGKATEFTAYAYGAGLKSTIEDKWGLDYNDYYEGPHYQFASESNPVDLSTVTGSMSGIEVNLPFPLNKPYFEYNEADGLYYRWEYGEPHIDAETGKQLAFENILLQNVKYVVFDENGYMMFHSIDYDREGYYLTNGKVIPVTWTKEDECSPTRYFNDDGEEITLNTGKTYVALIPDDIWNNMKIK